VSAKSHGSGDEEGCSHFARRPGKLLERTRHRHEHLTLNKITGVMKYTDDLSFPGMVYAKALRANIPSARLVRLDVSAAQAMPGILRVITAKDIPGKNIYGLIFADQPVLCDDLVRYVGDP